MRAIISAALLFLSTSAWAAVDTTPKSLPTIDWNCFQAFTTGGAYPEGLRADISIDGDNSDSRRVRYRLLTVNNEILKLIVDPSRPQFRTEKGIYVSEMTRDFINKHQIVGWRVLDAGNAIQYTLDFDNKLFSILKLSPQKIQLPRAQLDVLKCEPN